MLYSKESVSDVILNTTTTGLSKPRLYDMKHQSSFFFILHEVGIIGIKNDNENMPAAKNLTPVGLI